MLSTRRKEAKPKANKQQGHQNENHVKRKAKEKKKKELLPVKTSISHKIALIPFFTGTPLPPPQTPLHRHPTEQQTK
jgi:hypothetical protein